MGKKVNVGLLPTSGQEGPLHRAAQGTSWMKEKGDSSTTCGSGVLFWDFTLLAQVGAVSIYRQGDETDVVE